MSDRFNVSTIGRVTRDPELRFLANGTAVANFGLCTNQDYKKGEDWISSPLWSDWEAWGERAKFVADRLRKGSEVYVEGEYTTQTKEINGEKRTFHRFKLTHFRPLQKAVSDEVKVENGDKVEVEEMEEEIPF